MANVFELESLEPRVLLSSDGIGATQELLLPAEETAPVAESVQEFNRSVPTLEQSTPEADLFSEIASEELPAGHSQGAIAKQGAAQHNTLPDLTVSNVVINSSDWAHSFRVQFTLTNAGSAAVTGEEISHSLILSKVATYTPGDWQNEIFSQYYGYQVPQDGLGAGESVNIDTWIAVEDYAVDSALGSHYVHVVVDPWTSIEESNENNNADAGHAITLTKADINLSPTAITVPANGSRGSPVMVDLTVQNTGTDPATGISGKLYAQVYLSTDLQFDAPMNRSGDEWLV